MKTTKQWVALFSQSGKEICDIAEKIGRYPDQIVTDSSVDKMDKRIFNCKHITIKTYKGLHTVDKFLYYLNEFSVYDNNCLFTLHGWLNIVPPTICEKFLIYNGHPGLINVYPELKGRDPQERAWKNISGYEFVGSVIHRVTPEVDEGQICNYIQTEASKCTSLEQTYNVLRETSLKSWIDFLS